MSWARLLVAVGAVLGMSSVLLVIVMSLPRVLIGIGRDGMLPPRIFNAVHPVYGTPYRSVLLVGVTAALLGSLLPLRLVMDAVMAATLLGYAAVCVFVLVLRHRNASIEPVFVAPFGPVVPVAGIVICLVLMLSLPSVNLAWLAGWLLVGLLGYSLYGRRRSASSSASPPFGTQSLQCSAASIPRQP